MRKPADNGVALAAFIARKAEIDIILARLTALSSEHFDTAPDEVTQTTSSSQNAREWITRGSRRRRGHRGQAHCGDPRTSSDLGHMPDRRDTPTLC